MYPIAANFTDDAPLPPSVTPSHFFLPLEWTIPPSAPSTARLRARAIGFGVDTECAGPQNISFTTTPSEAGSPRISVKTTESSPGGDVHCGSNNIGISGYYDGINYSDNVVVAAHERQLALEGISPLTSIETHHGVEEACSTAFIVSWVRAGMHTDQTVTPSKSDALPNFQAHGVVCTPTLHVTEMEIMVDDQANVLQEYPADAVALDVADWISQALMFGTISGLFNRYGPTGGTAAGYWHSGNFAADWLNYLIKAKTKSSVHVDPQLPPPEPNIMAPLVADIVRRSWPMSLLRDEGGELPANPAFDGSQIRTGTLEYEEERMFFAPYMFEVSVTLLFINLIMAIMILISRPEQLLPQMPTTIAAVIAAFAGSSILDDLKNGTLSPEAMDKSNTKYSLGRYVGMDGQPYIGIDREQFVTLLPRKGVRERLGRRFVA